MPQLLWDNREQVNVVLSPQQKVLQISKRTFVQSYHSCCAGTPVLRQAGVSWELLKWILWIPSGVILPHTTAELLEYNFWKGNTTGNQNCLQWRRPQAIMWFPPALAWITPGTPRDGAVLVAVTGIQSGKKRAGEKLSRVERKDFL